MAPKVVVPMDFGIENLDCEFHGNVVLKLQGGEEMRANSLILSYHSSVFVHLFQELHQSELEMDDFCGDAVKTFLGALYSGEIKLDRNLFRDVNKMCHVFKVDWLSGRCREYYVSLLDKVTCSTDYQTLLFLFEEGRYCKNVIKSNEFTDLVVKKINGMDENKSVLFVQQYMKNYAALETNQLDLMLQITKNNPVSLLKIIARNIRTDRESINSISRYLLENIDLSQCMNDCEACCEGVFDVLDLVTQSSKSDALFVNSVYRKAMKGLNRKLLSEDPKATRADKQCEGVPPGSLENFKRARGYQAFPVPYYPLKDNFYRENKNSYKQPRSSQPPFLSPSSLYISSLSPSKKKSYKQPRFSGLRFETPVTLDISSLPPKRKKASEDQTVNRPDSSFSSKKRKSSSQGESSKRT